MNLLHKEKSLYLRQHKDNPVHWHAWGEEAFEKARKENKPLLVSIGYSSCHWCHVLAHESFEDKKVAEILNSLFVPIKVDKEEYPDIDSFYMAFMTQVFGSGGWPLNVFINHKKAPFYALTYAPKEQFIEVLYSIAEEYKNRKELHEQNIENTFALPKLSKEQAKEIISSLSSEIPPNYGGPQFPQAAFLLFALEKGNAQGVLKELENYITKGLFDHIEGGWFRYSVDPQYKIPHFEKMLYDQTTLLLLCAEAYMKKNNPLCKYAIEKTIFWLKEHMQLESKLFGSATDADTEEGEGYYYTIEKTDDETINKLFDLGNAGMHESRIHPWINIGYYEKHKKESEIIIENYKDKRKSYKKPGLDNKSVMSWNCFLGYSLLRCGDALKNREITDMGIQLFDSINKHHIKEKFHHVVYAAHPFDSQEYLEDYASYLLLLSEVVKITPKEKHKTEDIIEKIKEKFVKNARLLPTTEEFFDNFNMLQDTPFPSAGSILINALANLNSKKIDDIIPLIRGILEPAKNDPHFFGFWLQGFKRILND